jgi:hypothetical protein
MFFDEHVCGLQTDEQYSRLFLRKIVVTLFCAQIREQAAALRRPLGVRLFERTSITAEQRLNIFDDIATFSHIAADTGLEVWNELDQLHKKLSAFPIEKKLICAYFY